MSSTVAAHAKPQTIHQQVASFVHNLRTRLNAFVYFVWFSGVSSPAVGPHTRNEVVKLICFIARTRSRPRERRCAPLSSASTTPQLPPRLANARILI